MYSKKFNVFSKFIISMGLLSTSFFYSSNSYAISCVDVDECPYQVKKIKQYARYGSPSAQLILALLYESGTVVEGDPDKMFYWLRKAYKSTPKSSRINQAQHILALAYLNGNGTKKNISKGLEHLTKSATRGFVKSQLVLGLIYLEGTTVKADFDKANHWLQLAAKKKNSSAEYFLGQMNENGLGIEKNLSEAKKWYSLAAKHNSHTAIQRLEDFESGNSQNPSINIEQLYPEGIFATEENTIVIHPSMSELDIMDTHIEYLANKGLYTKRARTGSRIPGKICSQSADYCASETDAAAIRELMNYLQNVGQGSDGI